MTDISIFSEGITSS